MSEEKITPTASVGTSTQNSENGKEMGRRGFFKWLSLGWIAFASATGGFFLHS
jgi:hypothetical protein